MAMPILLVLVVLLIFLLLLCRGRNAAINQLMAKSAMAMSTVRDRLREPSFPQLPFHSCPSTAACPQLTP